MALAVQCPWAGSPAGVLLPAQRPPLTPTLPLPQNFFPEHMVTWCQQSNGGQTPLLQVRGRRASGPGQQSPSSGRAALQKLGAVPHRPAWAAGGAQGSHRRAPPREAPCEQGALPLPGEPSGEGSPERLWCLRAHLGAPVRTCVRTALCSGRPRPRARLPPCSRGSSRPRCAGRWCSGGLGPDEGACCSPSPRGDPESRTLVSLVYRPFVLRSRFPRVLATGVTHPLRGVFAAQGAV